MAEFAGMSQSMYSQVFNGKKRPSAEKARELEKRTGIDMRLWLFGDLNSLEELLYEKWNS